MKKQKLPNLVNIAILTVITVMFWIGLDVYRALTTKPPISVAPAVIANLNPTLDQTQLDKLPSRVYKEASSGGTTQLQTEPSLLSTPFPTPVPSASATPTVAPVASASPTVSPSATPTATP